MKGAFDNDEVLNALGLLTSAIAMSNWSLNREHQDRFDMKLDALKEQLTRIEEQLKEVK